MFTNCIYYLIISLLHYFQFIAPDYGSYISWEQTVKKGISLTGRKTGTYMYSIVIK
jgi:hypothetical protein